jgi:hypothetical protein
LAFATPYNSRNFGIFLKRDDCSEAHHLFVEGLQDIFSATCPAGGARNRLTLRHRIGAGRSPHNAACAAARTEPFFALKGGARWA